MKPGSVVVKWYMNLLFVEISFCCVDHAGSSVERARFTCTQNHNMHQSTLHKTVHKVSPVNGTPSQHAWNTLFATLHEVSVENRTPLPHAWKLSLWNTSQLPSHSWHQQSCSQINKKEPVLSVSLWHKSAQGKISLEYTGRLHYDTHCYSTILNTIRSH